MEIHDLSKAVSSLTVSPDNLTTIEFYTNGMTSGAGTFTLKNQYGSYKYIVILNTTGELEFPPLPHKIFYLRDI